MNKKYSLTPSTKGEMQVLLGPIFDLVRKNNIHSYYQLHKCESSQLEDKPKTNYIFQTNPRTPQTFHTTSMLSTHHKINHSLYSPEDRTLLSFSPGLKSHRMGHTIDFLSEGDIGKEEMKLNSESRRPSRVDRTYLSDRSQKGQKILFRVNSKIKKHLVEDINFEEIEKIFFKKRNALTRYQYFLKQKKQTNNTTKLQEKKPASCERAKVAIEQQMGVTEIIEKNAVSHKRSQSEEKSWLKGPHRRKFWVRHNIRKEAKDSHQYPIIAGKSYVGVGG